MAIKNKEVKVNVLAYEIRIKEKYKKYLPIENIYDLLKTINGMPYDREHHAGKCKLTGDGFDLCMNTLTELSSLDENKVNIIDFIMDKEVDETYYSKDKKGKYGLAKLEAGKVYCHKTHGRFMFKKKDKIWKLIVLLEKRHHNVWISHIFKYLMQFKPNWKFEYSQLAKKSDLIQKLNSIHNTRFIMLQDIDIQLVNESNETLSDRTYNNKFRKSFSTKEVRLNVKEDGLKGLLKELIREIFHNENPILNENTLKDLSSHLSLKVFGAIGDKYGWVDFFSDLVFYDFTLQKDNKTNELKSEDFFAELNSKVDELEISTLFGLV